MTCAVLFDIDGTILRAPGSGARALALALNQATGVSLERATQCLKGIDFRGATDRWILAQVDALLATRIADHGEEFVDSYLQHLEILLGTVNVEVLPGIRSLLAALSELGDVTVGLLTGNYRRAARIKLAHVSLEHLVGAAGGFGDDGIHRNELAAAAAVRLSAQGIPAERTIVIGDTQHDVTSGKHIGAYTVAVATGWTEPAALAACGPDLLFGDLSDPERLLSLVHRLR
jgi:phosphoglycolate phosphatase